MLVWGTTWHVITFQITDLAPEWGVAIRFAIAGTVVLLLSAWSGHRLRHAAATHAALALQGCFLYGLSYVCVYRAESAIPSGLVAVAYSASPLLTGVAASMVYGVVVGRRFVAGGLLGLLGVALIFWPEISRADSGARSTVGAALAIGSVLLSAVGSVAASRNRRNGVALLPAMGFGMLYGAATACCLGLVRGGVDGVAPSLPTTWGWWLSLAWLALAGSVLAFACFMTLQDRLGPGPAGTTGVMTPLLALVVSVLFEHFRPGPWTLIGAALAVAGNALMLRPAGPTPLRDRAPAPLRDAAPRPLRDGAPATE